jgi:hypothetical protein
VGGTVLAALTVAGLTWIRLAVGGATGAGIAVSPFWLFVSVIMVVPVALAYVTRPPRRQLGLGAGLVAGTALGVLTGVLVTASFQWALLAGLTVGAVVLAGVFALVTRD